MSYSQNAEDDIIAGCFPPDHKGLVIEIGAWEPVNFSNSRLLIQAGWDAILCEFSPMPVHKLIEEYGENGRVRILQVAITPCDQHVRQFRITQDALSTDSAEEAARWKGQGGYYGWLWVPTLTWDMLTSQFTPTRKPDVVSVDTEGGSVDLAIVIMQSDWRPRVLVVEHNGRQVEIMQEAKKHKYAVIEITQENMVLCR